MRSARRSVRASGRTSQGEAVRAPLGAFVALVVSTAMCRPSTAASRVTGTYRLERTGGSGCVIAAAPARGDSIRVQLACDRGPPSHNLGFLDTRLPLRDDRAVFETRQYRGRCVLAFAFEASRVI